MSGAFFGSFELTPCVCHRNRYARLAGQQAGGATVKAGTAAKKEVYIALQALYEQ